MNYHGCGLLSCGGCHRTLCYLVVPGQVSTLLQATVESKYTRDLWRNASGGWAFAVSFETCGYRNSCRVKPLQKRVTRKELVNYVFREEYWGVECRGIPTRTLIDSKFPWHTQWKSMHVIDNQTGLMRQAAKWKRQQMHSVPPKVNVCAYRVWQAWV